MGLQRNWKSRYNLKQYYHYLFLKEDDYVLTVIYIVLTVGCETYIPNKIIFFLYFLKTYMINAIRNVRQHQHLSSTLNWWTGMNNKNPQSQAWVWGDNSPVSQTIM